MLTNNSLRKRYPESESFANQDKSLKEPNLNSLNWIPSSSPPELRESEYCHQLESFPVLGVTTYGKRLVVKAYQEHSEKGEPSNPIKWESCCSEGWDMTREILFWHELPSADGLDGVGSGDCV